MGNRKSGGRGTKQNETLGPQPRRTPTPLWTLQSLRREEGRAGSVRGESDGSLVHSSMIKNLWMDVQNTDSPTSVAGVWCSGGGGGGGGGGEGSSGGGVMEGQAENSASSDSIAKASREVHRVLTRRWEHEQPKSRAISWRKTKATTRYASSSLNMRSVALSAVHTNNAKGLPYAAEYATSPVLIFKAWFLHNEHDSDTK